ncbi:hypothetical protein GCM10009549_45590 [Streptomyces thermoalcalitolerans]|uniref:Secreted protein n=1 Tax=Streptomyces thermoalcalitolerans TaxID=65605 RepID=A0ABN1P967_9ACTN
MATRIATAGALAAVPNVTPTPGWFWAAGTSNARTASPRKGSSTGADNREVILPYPPDIRRYVPAESFAGGAR